MLVDIPQIGQLIGQVVLQIVRDMAARFGLTTVVAKLLVTVLAVKALWPLKKDAFGLVVFPLLGCWSEFVCCVCHRSTQNAWNCVPAVYVVTPLWVVAE